MHGSNSKRSGILPLRQPFVIARADFEKLYPVYQKMALALVQTGKVLIIDYSPSLDPSALPALQGLPSAERDCSYREPTGSPFGGWGESPRCAGGAWGAAAPLHRRGVATATPPSNGLQAVALGNYRLIRNTVCVKVEE